MNLDTCTPGQKTIITTLDKPLMVSAGAGSGKTFTLTQRIAYAFETGYLDSIDQILAITFTRKAASELKTRIKKQLLSMGLTDEALRIDDAWISTIHGMCSRILKEHALELGLDPAFELLSDVEQKTLLETALNQVYQQLEEDPVQVDVLSFVQERSSGGLSSSVVSQALALRDKVYALPDGFDSLVIDKPASSANALLRELLDLGYEFREVAQAWTKKGKAENKALDDLDSALEGALEYLNSVQSTFEDTNFDARAYLATLLAFPKTSPSFHAKKDDAAFFADYRAEYVRIASEAESSISCIQLGKLVRFTRMIDQAYDALKGSEVLDNTDLLTKTYAALRNHPSIAQSYRDQFKLIMVDEFQDTDALQVGLIDLLSTDHFGNVTTVGDAQQSIYRFRGADVQVFFGYQERLSTINEQAQLVSLPDNFRSHRDVLSFVDTIFGQKSVFGDRFLSLAPRGDVNKKADGHFDTHPRISMSLFETRRSQSSLDQARTCAAKHIAQTFARLRDVGVPADDMVVLLGSLTHVSYYLEALRSAGFEATIAGGTVFSSSGEAALVDSLLRFAANPLDLSAGFEVLTSPLFNCSDADLLQLKTFASRHAETSLVSYDYWDCFTQEFGSSASSVVTHALKLLETYLAITKQQSVVEALYWIVEASGYWLRLQRGGAEGMACAGNLLKALRFAQDYRDEGLGVVETAQEYSLNLAALKESPGVLSTDNSDFVRIMTIHASKGLEFPHVAVGEMRLGNSSSTTFMVDNIEGKTYAFIAAEKVDSVTDLSKLKQMIVREEEVSAQAVISAPTAGERSAALGDYELAQEREEARRLLYVALTRASKSLCLSLAIEGNKDFNYASKGVLFDLFTALQWETGDNHVKQRIEYGGTHPLEFELTVLQKEEDEPQESESEDNGSAEQAFAGSGSAGESVETDSVGNERADEVVEQESAEAVQETSTVFVVSQTLPDSLNRAVLKRVRSHNLVSYSALSEYAHSDKPHTDKPHAAHVDDPKQEKCDTSDNSSAYVDSTASQSGGPALLDEVSALFDDESTETLESLFADDFERDAQADAVSLGSAFHRLAQRGILYATEDGLKAPTLDDIRIQAAHYGLQTDQVHRLINAVKRWFDSSLAQEFVHYGKRDAEVPFCVRFGHAPSSFVLEGEIDGLAVCDKKAFFIDYKTGGNQDETPEELQEKYQLQAQCYSYALLRLGFESVEAVFVRVEQQDGSLDGDQPQTVRYVFTRDDADRLSSAIVSAWQQMAESNQ